MLLQLCAVIFFGGLWFEERDISWGQVQYIQRVAQSVQSKPRFGSNTPEVWARKQISRPRTYLPIQICMLNGELERKKKMNGGSFVQRETSCTTGNFLYNGKLPVQRQTSCTT